jgi:hypothetical protein
LTGGGRKQVLLAVALFLTLFGSFGAWAMSSPVGSSPDDTFHLGSIWCASDVPGRECDLVGGAADKGTENRLLPADLIGSSCYAMHKKESAACQRRLDGGLVPSPTNDGLYPGTFYSVMHLFAGHDAARSVVTMRVVNGGIAALLISVALVLAPIGLRRASALAWLVGLVPLGMFFVPSTNPSTWTIIGIGTYWVFLLRFLTGPRGRGTWLAGVMAVVSALLAVSSRVDGSAYLCVVTGASLLLGVDRLRDLLSPRSVLPVLIGLAAFVRFATLRASDVLVSGASPLDANEPGRHGLSLLTNNLFNYPTYLVGMVGQSFGLGWLDTSMPPAVGPTGAALVAIVLVLSIGSYWTWKRVAVGLLCATVVAVPLLVLQQSHAFVGEIVQPRYAYPLVLVVLGAVSYTSERPGARPLALRRSHLVILVAGASLANALALHTQIKRYVTGLGGRALDLDAAREWWWTAGPSPQALWMIGSVVGLAAFAALAGFARVAPVAADATVPETPGSRESVAV